MIYFTCFTCRCIQCTNGVYPDQSAVEIQYAAVYTEGILPSIQCTWQGWHIGSRYANPGTWSIYCQFSIPYTAVYCRPRGVYIQCILQLYFPILNLYCTSVWGPRIQFNDYIDEGSKNFETIQSKDFDPVAHIIMAQD